MKKITRVEFVSYDRMYGYLWHKKNGMDKEIHVTTPLEVENEIAKKLEIDGIKYDKLILQWR